MLSKIIKFSAASLVIMMFSPLAFSYFPDCVGHYGPPDHFSEATPDPNVCRAFCGPDQWTENTYCNHLIHFAPQVYGVACQCK